MPNDGPTVDEYRAQVRAYGLTPCGRLNSYSTLHQTRENDIIQVPDPEPLTPPQRAAALATIRLKLGINAAFDAADHELALLDNRIGELEETAWLDASRAERRAYWDAVL